MCHDRKGFCFDGFSIADSYEVFEKRLAITEHTRNIENPENPEWIEVLENPDNIGAPEKIEEIQIRTYKREGEEQFSIVADVVWQNDYPGVKGSVSYQFYKGQFFQEELWAEFPSYRAAKDYIEERMDAVSAYRDKEYEKRQEQDGITDGGWRKVFSFLLTRQRTQKLTTKKRERRSSLGVACRKAAGGLL